MVLSSAVISAGDCQQHHLYLLLAYLLFLVYLLCPEKVFRIFIHIFLHSVIYLH